MSNSLTMAEAAARVLAEEMRRDPTVWVLGEDVETGGVFGQYKGLLGEFGAARVVNTPIAEATIMGAGLGAALVGTRPVIEMRIADFVMPAMDELVNQVAKARYMFGGQARASLVVRMPHGLLRGSAAQHSQVIESWFVNVPGLVVIAPSNALELAGLLRSAIRCDDPVVFFEPKGFFRQTVTMPDEWPAIPIGAAAHLAGGDDITIVSWAQAMPAAIEAATTLAGGGHRCRSLRPAHPLALGPSRSARVGPAHAAAGRGAGGARSGRLRRRGGCDGGRADLGASGHPARRLSAHPRALCAAARGYVPHHRADGA